jgi:hypothetical protein
LPTVASEGHFTVEEILENDHEGYDFEDHDVIWPHQYEDAESEREHSVKSAAHNDLDSRFLSGFKDLRCENEEDAREIWLEQLRAEKRRKRWSSGSALKRTLSQSIGSDMDDEDLQSGIFEGANELGSSARRVRTNLHPRERKSWDENMGAERTERTFSPTQTPSSSSEDDPQDVGTQEVDALKVETKMTPEDPIPGRRGDFVHREGLLEELVDKMNVTEREREDDSESDFGQNSTGSSIASFADSLLSQISGSSVSSIVDSQGAGERLVHVLLDDLSIGPMCSKALESIHVTLFESKLRRFLKEFAIELRAEARTIPQRRAAHFVRYRARNSAHLICRELMENKIRIASENIVGTEVQQEDSSDESGSDRSDDVLDNMQQLELFIKTSKAIDVLRQKLSRFIESSQVVYTPFNVAEDYSTYATGFGTSNAAVEKRHTHNVFSMIRQLFGYQRPPLTLGMTRIEWQCVSCLRRPPFLADKSFRDAGTSHSTTSKK